MEAALTTTVFTVFPQSDLVAGTYTSPGFEYDGAALIGTQFLSSNWSSVAPGVINFSAQQSFDGGTTWTEAAAFTSPIGVSTTNKQGNSCVGSTGSFIAVDGLGPRLVRVAVTIPTDMNIGLSVTATTVS